MTARETVVVAAANDPIEAGMWVNALEQAGIQARSFERGVGAALGGAVTASSARYPVIVKREDLARARSVIADHGGAAALEPVEEPADVRERQNQALITVGLIVVAFVALAVIARLIAG